jgi:tRNA threonylcarbamoyladenosine biosynthesis protein TsaB
VKILALDTATENCSAALLWDEGLSARERLLERGHAASILAMVDEVLAESGACLADLSAIAFGRGPGSFTGVRLAASLTQGLSFGAGVPVVPVSDLRAVAQRALHEEAAAQCVLVCNDARMREVYWGCFARSPEGLAELIGNEQAGDPGRVALPAGWPPDAVVWGAGTGFGAYPALARMTQNLRVLPGLYPRAVEIAHLAVPEVRAGRVFEAAEALPTYLRDDVVQSRTDGH